MPSHIYKWPNVKPKKITKLNSYYEHFCYDKCSGIKYDENSKANSGMDEKNCVHACERIFSWMICRIIMCECIKHHHFSEVFLWCGFTIYLILPWIVLVWLSLYVALYLHFEQFIVRRIFNKSLHRIKLCKTKIMDVEI